MSAHHEVSVTSDFCPAFDAVPWGAPPSPPSTIDELKESLSNYVDLQGSGGLALEIGLDALEQAGKQQVIYESNHVLHLMLEALRNPINSESPCEIILAAIGVWGLTENIDADARMNLMSLLEAGFSVIDQNSCCDI